MKDLEGGDEPIDEDIAAFDMGEFVEENEAEFAAGETLAESGGEEQARAEKAVESGAGDLGGFQELNGSRDVHLGFALVEEVSESGICEGAKMFDAPKETDGGQENMGGEKEDAAEPDGEEEHGQIPGGGRFGWRVGWRWGGDNRGGSWGLWSDRDFGLGNGERERRGFSWRDGLRKRRWR
jgi:hypothetical protein